MPPAPSRSFSITGNAAIDGLILKGLTSVAVMIATIIITWANAHGWHLPDINTKLIEALIAIMSVPVIAIWGWLANKAHTVKAVQSGINLVMSGAALFQDAGTGDGAKTAIPVTPATAEAIVQNFATTPVVVKALPAI